MFNSNPKPLPELYEKKENCCGCSACFASCPVGAIFILRWMLQNASDVINA